MAQNVVDTASIAIFLKLKDMPASTKCTIYMLWEIILCDLLYMLKTQLTINKATGDICRTLNNIKLLITKLTIRTLITLSEEWFPSFIEHRLTILIDMMLTLAIGDL